MSRAHFVGAVCAASLALGAPSQAYLIQTFSSPSGAAVQQSWATDAIGYAIDSAGSDDVPAEAAARILRESFSVWGDLAGSRIRFQDQGLAAGRTPSGRDRRNLILFDETGHWLGAPAGSGIIAITRIESDVATGRILDADIVFNGRDIRFSAEPRAGRVLLRDVAVHEIGHLLGLEHTTLAGPAPTRPTMNPFYFGDGPGEASTLEADDVAGVSVLYPTAAFLAATGAIVGRVSSVAGDPVFGANVTVESLDSGAFYSTLSGAETGADDPGAYAVRGLPAGRYRLAIAPLGAGIDESSFSGLFRGLAGGFPAEYFDNVERPGLARTVEVAPGSQAAGVDFTTGLLLPGQSLVRPLLEPANTPDAHGPYLARFAIDNASRADLVVSPSSGTALDLPMAQVQPGVFEARIPGQPVGSRIRYRARAVSPTGVTTDYPGPDAWLQFDVIALSGSPLVFAVLRDDDVLAVFDTGRDREVARVAVGDQPVQVLTAQEGRFLYVSHLGSSDIAVIEAATFRVIDRIPVAAQPLDMALSRDGRTLYVANSGASSLTAIDLASRRVQARIPVGSLTAGPHGVAAGAGDRVYVTDLASDLVLSVAGGSVVARIPVADQPRSLASSADGRELYVTSFASGVLTIIDTAADRVVATVGLPVSGGFAVAAHPDGRRVYVTGHDDGVVLVVDGPARRVVEAIRVGTNPRGLALSSLGDRLYVTSASSNEIYILDAAADALVDTYATTGGPRGIAVVTPAAPPQMATAVSDAEAAPKAWSLSALYPNPFNPQATLTVSVPEAAGAAFRVGVYDALGRRVRTLVVAAAPGLHRVSWDGRDESGGEVASGVYLFTLEGGDLRSGGAPARKGLLIR